MTSPTTVATKRARRFAWIPNQKGAWMMVAVPYWAGAIGGGFRWQHLLVFACYLSGYSLFFTTENFIKAHHPNQKTRRPNIYALPLKFWLSITAILGLISLWFCGALVVWAVFFAPIIVAIFWQISRHNYLSLFTRLCEVSLTSLMCAVAWDLAVRSDLRLTALWATTGSSSLASSPAFIDAVVCTACFALYFWSTVPYVKSLFREKGSSFYLALSGGSHVAGLVATTLLWGYGYIGIALPIFWALLCIRAAVVTRLSRTLEETPRTPTRTDITDHPGSSPSAKPIFAAPSTLTAKKLLISVGVTETFISVIYAAILLNA